MVKGLSRGLNFLQESFPGAQAGEMGIQEFKNSEFKNTVVRKTDEVPDLQAIPHPNPSPEREGLSSGKNHFLFLWGIVYPDNIDSRIQN